MLISETTETITERGLAKSSAVLHPAGVVILARDAGVGQSAVAARPLAVSQHFVAWNCGPKLHNFFLYYWLQWLKPELERIANGSTIKTIGLPYFEKLSIPLPPLPEQIEIVRVLTAWDKAIAGTSALIDAKGRFKRALLQVLVTGERRFEEFQGEPWRVRKLGELFSERNEANRPDLPLLSITSDRGVIPRGESERKDSSNEDKKAYLRIAPGDIGYNTMRMWQGVSAVSRLEGIISPAYTVCVPNELIDADFAGYLFKFGPMVSLFERHSQGMVADTLSLKFHHFSRLSVLIPGRAEQQRIVAVFKSLDAEIAALEQQLLALKSQKRGLMQKLLSGEVRVSAGAPGNLDDVPNSNPGGES